LDLKKPATFLTASGKSDYAALLLVDRRYSTPRISSKLPKWIGQDIKVGNFPDAVRNVAGFFKSKKTNGYRLSTNSKAA
jgi:hypothetical protein